MLWEWYSSLEWTFCYLGRKENMTKGPVCLLRAQTTSYFEQAQDIKYRLGPPSLTPCPSPSCWGRMIHTERRIRSARSDRDHKPSLDIRMSVANQICARPEWWGLGQHGELMPCLNCCHVGRGQGVPSFLISQGKNFIQCFLYLGTIYNTQFICIWVMFNTCTCGWCKLAATV